MTSTKASICVGLVGHQRAGKSALLKVLLDNEFDLTSDDARRQTEDLEFAHACIHRCTSPPSTITYESCYRSSSGLLSMEEGRCGTPGHEMQRMSISRRAMFVDCPGNPFSVPTMLKGIMMADGVLILSRPSHPEGFFTAPTMEVLAAANLMGKSIAVVQVIQNIADENQLEQHHQQIRSAISDLKIPWNVQIPILPLSAQDIMSDVGGICRQIDLMAPPRTTEASDSPALVLIGRSCLVTEDEDDAGDASGEENMTLKIYGRVVKGAAVPAADEVVEVRPGIVTRGADGNMVCHPIFLKVTADPSAAADQEEESDDGLVVVLRASTKISGENPQLLRNTLRRGGLQGHMLGLVGSLPLVHETLRVKISLVQKMWDPYGSIMKRVKRMEVGQELLLIVGTLPTYGRVRSVEGTNVKTIVVGGLSPPTCARQGENILICRKLELGWHLIGRGEITAGRSIAVADNPAA